jgi:hypothetical protein
VNLSMNIRTYRLQMTRKSIEYVSVGESERFSRFGVELNLINNQSRFVPAPPPFLPLHVLPLILLKFDGLLGFLVCSTVML